MLIGYMRVSKADGSQTLDLQRDALLVAPTWKCSQNCVTQVDEHSHFSFIRTAKSHGLDPLSLLCQIVKSLPHCHSLEDYEAYYRNINKFMTVKIT
jgi:hypothetical protein